MARLLYQGHGSSRIVTDAGKVLYIDPYAGTGYDLPADIILVTHQHGDHNKTDLARQNAGCRIITNTEAIADGKHQIFNINGIKIEAVEACNRNHPIDKCVGYIITADGVQIYISGDTSQTKQMETFAARHLDFALLCCDGVYNMDLGEAARCAKIIGAKRTIPVHMKPGALFDAARAEAFSAQNKLVLSPNQEIALGFSPCGYDCAAECDEFGTTCGGCNTAHGVVSWLGIVGAKICPVYDCVANKNKLAHCGKCGQMPCALYDDGRDPQMSDAQHTASVKQRAEFLSRKK